MLLQLQESKLFINALQVAGPAFFLSMQASSVKTALSIISDKSVKSLSPLPFVSLLTNCLIWTFYGILKADNTVLIPNACGILSGAFCVSTYHAYSVQNSNSIYLIAATIIAAATVLAVQGSVSLLGTFGCVLAVFLMGSPLATLKTVIQDKSTASIPFATSFSGWCNALSWTLYGYIVAKDALIYGPNGIGFILASAQMLLFVVYGFPKSVTTPLTSTGKSLF